MATASQALSLGLCAYPATGHTDPATPKRPFGKWRDYQTRRPTDVQLSELYSQNSLTTVGLICGAISDGLECLDFDTKDGYQRFRAVVTTSGLAPVFQRIEAGYSEQSPKGVHLLYFCEAVDGSKKLNEQLKIETAGCRITVVALSCWHCRRVSILTTLKRHLWSAYDDRRENTGIPASDTR